MDNEGVLEVYDIHGLPSHQMSCGQVTSGVWIVKYCVLTNQKLWMFDLKQSNNLFGDGDNGKDVDVFQEERLDESAFSADSTSDNRRRNQASENVLSPTKDGVSNFLQRKIQPSIRRSKSTKLTAGKENYPILDPLTFMAQGGGPSRNADVELPFFMPSIESPDAIDLNEDLPEKAIVRPLHHSILGREYCFEIITNKGTRCFGCNSNGEREAWIEKIRRAINPNLDNCHRIEHQLTLFVQEAKGLPAKKKYFCEICLDRKLCARTTSKLKNDSTVFWGEQFQFTSMPKVDDITVHLYKDSDKKKKKDKDYIGLVNLSCRSLVNQQSLEQWYTLSTPSGNSKNKAGEPLAVRIKARFQSIHVLPTEVYKAFAEHISLNYLPICKTLGNVLAVSKKDELAKIMVNIMYATGCIKDYMSEIVMGEVEKVVEESLIFRENTVGTKSVEAFLRLVGMKYLHEALGEFIQAIFTMEEECEVDGSRLPPHAHLEANQKNLHMSCEIALCKITSSIDCFPSELREVLSIWRMKCEAAGRPRIANRLVTASLFLRLLCPSILNPSLFGLANEVPDPKTSRILTLIAKVIQNLANRNRFGNKEEYMQFMDAFVRQKWDVMEEFIGNVSDPEYPALTKGFDGYIDLGKEFARLHAFFAEVLPTLNENVVSCLGCLPDILAKITILLENPSHATSATSESAMKRSQTESSHDLSKINEDQSINMTTSASVHGLDDGSVTNGYSPPPLHGSRSSVADASSCNNSNNNTASSRHRSTLLSTENLEKIGGGVVRESPPLMFSNPAFQLQQQKRYVRGVSSPASLPTSELSAAPDPKYGARGSPGSGASPARAGNAANSREKSFAGGPLAFSNPLQVLAMGGKSNNRHLETVFTTETVTYSAPRPTHLKPANHRPFRLGAHDTDSSNDSDDDSHTSSLSSRQSSTTTADDTASSSENSPLLTRHAVASQRQHRHHQQQKQPHQGVSKSVAERMDDDGPMVSATTVPSSLSSAGLRTGLQSYSSHRESPTGRNPPQPKARTSFIDADGNKKRKTSAPNLLHPVTPLTHYNSPKRLSIGVVPLSRDDVAKSVPSLQFAPNLDSAILQLKEDTLDESRQTKSKDGVVSDDLVSASVPVRSRVVVCSSNATRVKTAKHMTGQQQQKQAQQLQLQLQQQQPAVQQSPKQSPTAQTAPVQPVRRSSQKKVTPVHKFQRVGDDPGAPVQGNSLPPATSEDPISPEARTAQWILNNVPAPGKDPKRSGESEHHPVLTPKDYEDRIIRLETEVERMRSLLKAKNENQRSQEHKETQLNDKIHKQQQNGEKLRRDLDARDEQVHQLMQSLFELESKQQRERSETQAVLESKDGLVSEQLALIDKLKLENARLLETIGHLKLTSAGSETPNSRPDPKRRSDKFRPHIALTGDHGSSPGGTQNFGPSAFLSVYSGPPLDRRVIPGSMTSTSSSV